MRRQPVTVVGMVSPRYTTFEVSFHIWEASQHLAPTQFMLLLSLPLLLALSPSLGSLSLCCWLSLPLLALFFLALMSA